MALSVTEKQHWKDRIDQKIKRRIESLKALNATYFAEMETAAKLTAATELGIHSDIEAIRAMEQKIEKLQNDSKKHLLQVIEKISGKQLNPYYAQMDRVDTELKPHIERCLHKLLTNDPRGQEVIKLESEREQLLDTIWLATSSRQVRDMWTQVLKLLGEDSSEFQKEVIAAAKPGE